MASPSMDKYLHVDLVPNKKDYSTPLFLKTKIVKTSTLYNATHSAVELRTFYTGN